MILFTDELFDKNLKFLKIKNIVWKRPHQIVDNPQFIESDINIDDISQGFLGNCWLISTINVLFNSFENFISILNPLQTFNKLVYNGKFSFNFVLNNKRCLIEIDDLIPTVNNKLIFCKNNKNENEFWCSLLEKAIAKITNNSYESIDFGRNLNGALYYFNINDYSLMETKNCIIDVKNNYYLLGSHENSNINDLVSSHVYSLLDFSFNSYTKKFLLKIKNPYSNNKEYTKQLMLTKECNNKNNGIFWIEKNLEFFEYFPYILEFRLDCDCFYNRQLFEDFIVKSNEWKTILTLKKPIILIGVILNNRNNRNAGIVLKYSCFGENINFKKDLIVLENNKQSYFGIELNAILLFKDKTEILLSHKIECEDKIFLNEIIIISKII